MFTYKTYTDRHALIHTLPTYLRTHLLTQTVKYLFTYVYMYSCLQPILTKMALSGPVELAKYSVKCIQHTFKDPQPILEKLCAVSYCNSSQHLCIVPILLYTLLLFVFCYQVKAK